MPLLLFRAQFILMSHFRMAEEKHHNHTESDIVYKQTQNAKKTENTSGLWSPF